MAKVKSAREHIRDINRHERKKARAARREMTPMQLEMRDCKGLREQAVTMIRASGLTFQQIEEAGGPVVATLNRWFDFKVPVNPQTPTLNAAARVCGFEVGFHPKGWPTKIDAPKKHKK
jgi:hypothetical protein